MKIRRIIKDIIVGKENQLQDGDGYHYEYNEQTRTKDDEWKDFLKYDKYPFLIGCFYSILLTSIIIGICCHIYAILNLNIHPLPTNMITLLLWTIIPFIIWIWSTHFTYWNYWRRKLLSLQLGILNFIVIGSQQLLRFFYRPIMLVLSKIPINVSITAGMVVNLGRFLLILVSLIPGIIVCYKLFSLVYERDYKKDILYFKISRGQDLRQYKKFRYDFKVVRVMETGQPYLVKEKDRTLHMFADGTTGTAKTSSVLSPAIADDMDQKVLNEDYQKKICLEEIKKGHFKITQPFKDQDFSINYIEPVMQEGIQYVMQNKARQNKYEFLKFTVQSAGITVVAPNAAWADEVYEMSSSRCLKVNRVDPILTKEGKQKPGFIGFNPFYISPLLSGVERDVDITNKANIFADILQAYYEMSGSGDAYFISLNNSVTKATCKLLMLTYAYLHGGRQPDAGDVQRCINDFTLMRPYLDILVKKYSKKQYHDPFDKVAAASYGIVDCGIWQDVYVLINNDLLGPNSDNMVDRANGLRLQINNFINHPLIRRVFCAKDSLDIDKALANGEIIIVNYALELGKSVASMFGLCFLLSFSKACLRRPGTENSRILNLNYIDEFPVLLHPDIEEFFTLHRQYKIANTVALQTLDQMLKSKVTEYLKGILLGNCAHQIVFGRVSPSEMAIYESMAGKMVEMLSQDTISQTSITTDNPSYSYSSRLTRQISNRIEGSDIRHRDFQEVTFFTVDDGSPVYPFVGRVNFLPSAKRKSMPRLVANWQRFYPEELLVKQANDPVDSKQFEFQLSGQIQRNNVSQTGLVRFSAKGLIPIASKTEKYIMSTVSSQDEAPTLNKATELERAPINNTGVNTVSDSLRSTSNVIPISPDPEKKEISLDDIIDMADI